MKNYNYGLRAKDRLAAAYSRRGHTTSFYERSRGPADIVIVRGGRRLHMQVKSIRSRTTRIVDADAAFEIVSSRLSDHDLTRLTSHATASGGQPAIGLTHGDYYWTWRLRAVREGYDFELLHHGLLPTRALERT